MSWMALAFLAACSGGGTTDDKTDTNVPGDDDDDDDDNGGTPTAETGGGGGGGGGLDPVAVGFEFDGILNGDGSLLPYGIDGVFYAPIMILTFADLEFFSLSGDDQEGHYCTAIAFFATDPAYGGIVATNNVPTADGLPLYWSYETAIDVETDPEFTDCDELVDAAKWGENAELMLEPFDGAHFGWGFGQMTDYLRDAWTDTTIKEIGDSMLAGYTAINDSSGAWEAYDWTTLLAFEADATTGELVADADGYLVGLDVSTVAPGNPLPFMYVRSFAFWYQDFIYMDFENLKDGAP